MKRYFYSLIVVLIFGPTVRGQITRISGEIDNLTNDTVRIVLQINSITRESDVRRISVKNGKFTDTFQISRPTYFYTNDGANYISGLIEPGDRIFIRYHADSANTTLQFTGTGAEKMSFITSLFRLKIYDFLLEQLPITRTKKYPFDYTFNYVDSIGNAMLKKLDSIKKFIKPETYDLLSADVKATVMSNKYRGIGLIYHESIYETLQKRQGELTNTSRQYIQNILSFDQKLFYSASYINAVYNMLFVDYDGLQLDNRSNKSLINKYAHLSKKLPDSLKVPVLTLFLEQDIKKLNQGEDLETLIRQIYSSPKDSVYRNYIENRYSGARIFKKGTNAPDFVLENEKGEKVTLAYFKGKVLYIDFWYAACGPCHALFKTIEPVKKYFSSKDVVFLNISIDSKEIWKAAIKKYKIPGYHVFTENRETNHPVISLYKVAGYPTTCLVDRNGKVFISNPSTIPGDLQNEIEEALATIVSN